MDGRPPLPPKTGTVTSLASVFPVEEALKASERVQDALAERQKQLDELRGFISDNTSLINLVQRLPDDLHHHIMVPFGKAAFFPGKLIHTNEFLILLGEGYYADRTAKQTVDILKRRGKALDSQVESLKAVTEDLKAEASFFNATATEAAEGLVEIREDFVDETSTVPETSASSPKSDLLYDSDIDNAKAVDKDDEYNRILSRLDELEKEEEEAENADKSDEDEIKDKIHPSDSQHILREESRSSEVESPKRHFKSKEMSYSDGSLRDKDLAVSQPNLAENVSKLPEGIVSARAPLTTKEEIPTRSSEPTATSSKAFTGSIVERNVDMNPLGQPTVGRSSKPVSRFKLQRK